MITRKMVINIKAGLHARPAFLLVKTANRFKSSVIMKKNEQVFDAKSIISILSAAVSQNTQVEFIIDGEDEELAEQELLKLMAADLGEDEALFGYQVILKGVSASPGIEIGKALVIKEQEINNRQIANGQVAEEAERFHEAVKKTRAELKGIREKAEKELCHDKAEIFDAHVMILDDPNFLLNIKQKIEHNLVSADTALIQVISEYSQMFDSMNDIYLKERIADIKDVVQRIVRNLNCIADISFSETEEAIILVTRDLTPSQTVQIDKNIVKSFVTDIGGRTSHTAIIAKSLGIPAVVGVTNVSNIIKDGDMVIVDGNKGIVYVNPNENTLADYIELRENAMKITRELHKIKNFPPETRDRVRRVVLAANIDNTDDLSAVAESGAEGIGLFRTEFLYMNRTNLPDENEQFQTYKSVVSSMAPHPVTIRTLDVGGDKNLPYLYMPEEENPFLGSRGIRVSLKRPEVLKTQLKAILRASSYGKVRIVYPVISTTEEVDQVNAILQAAKDELDKMGVSYDSRIETGIMIEIPAAALIADILIKKVDFFSIGTNDLIQHTLAVDRIKENISHLYQPFHPAVLRLIQNVIYASHREDKWTGMCGEMAGDELATPILLGMGLDEFSMGFNSIPRVKNAIRSLLYEDAKNIAIEALSLKSAEEISKLVREFKY
jgi:phosphoenolpyruvate-protein phosphotransferase (PTS system enzyme I)